MQEYETRFSEIVRNSYSDGTKQPRSQGLGTKSKELSQVILLFRKLSEIYFSKHTT